MKKFLVILGCFGVIISSLAFAAPKKPVKQTDLPPPSCKGGKSFCD